MANELATTALDKAVIEGCKLTRTVKATFSAALDVARVAQSIRQALTTEMVSQLIMPLKDCDFGWRTDEKAGGKTYSLEQIRDVWVSAALVGAVPINNEVNVISARMYLCKNYFTRMLRDFPGLTDLILIPGKVTMQVNGALVEYKASWKLDGKPMSLDRTGASAFPIRLNTGMGADGALGKAERKMKSAIYSMLTGSSCTENDTD